MSEPHAPGAPVVDQSVVIPAYNEESRLALTLERVVEYLQAQDYSAEIVVVDDGSRDGTLALAQDFARRRSQVRVVANDGNRGKGFSVRHGVQESRGRLVLFSDADLSTPIEELEPMRALVLSGECQVAIASRALPESNLAQRQPLPRELMGRTFNKLVQLLAVPGIVDTQCGFKLFTAEAAQRIFALQTIDGFAFDVEVLFIARRLGYAIREVPVTWIDSPDSRVDPVRDSARMLREIALIRWKALRGCYGPRESPGG